MLQADLESTAVRTRSISRPKKAAKPRKLDLNLFRVFDTVMRTRNLTAASRELHLTPSAVSHALSRLRTALGDPLFVATDAGMEPTAHALELAPHVSGGLSQIGEALRSPKFSPSESSRTFRIAALDYASVMILPRLMARMAEVAPNIDLCIVPFNRVETTRQLNDGRIDIVAGWFDDLPTHLRRRLLLRDAETIVVRADHPLATGEVPLRRLVEFPFVMVELFSGSSRPADDDCIEEHGASRRSWIDRLLLQLNGSGELPPRRAAIVVPHYASVLPIVAATDMVGILPRGYAQAEIDRGLVQVLDLPYALPAGGLEAVWHRRGEYDTGLMWLVTEMVEVLASPSA